MPFWQIFCVLDDPPKQYIFADSFDEALKIARMEDERYNAGRRWDGPIPRSCQPDDKRG